MAKTTNGAAFFDRCAVFEKAPDKVSCLKLFLVWDVKAHLAKFSNLVGKFYYGKLYEKNNSISSGVERLQDF